MAQHYDVAGRLAEGREAVAHSQTYVSACYRLGYRHPELTGYDGQLADSYDSEAGLDLRALDADCAALGALADTADDVLRQQRAQLAEFTTAWRGRGADAAAEFLRRHCDAGGQLTSRLRAAAAGCAALRDELWRLVDTKVAAVLAIDDRAGGARPAWLAAAHAVNAGATDDHAAEVVEKQVMPHVDSDVRGEWLPAVRSAKDGAAAAYRSASAAADPAPGVMFAVPGDLGPEHQPEESQPVGPPAAAAVIPAAAPSGEPPEDPATKAPPVPDDPEPPPAPVDDVPDDLGMPSGLGLPGDLGVPSGGLPGAGSGLGGLGGLGGLIPRLADALGDNGLGEPFSDPFEDPAGPDEHDADDPDDPDEHDADDPDDAEGSDDPESEPAVEAAAEEAVGDADGEQPESDDTETAEEARAAPEPVPLAADTAAAEEPEQAPETVPDAPAKTPCETAAEELPQVGQ